MKSTRQSMQIDITEMSEISKIFQKERLVSKAQRTLSSNPSEVNDSFVPTFVQITNRIDTELHGSQETAVSPLDQDIITLPETGSKTTNNTLK